MAKTKKKKSPPARKPAAPEPVFVPPTQSTYISPLSAARLPWCSWYEFVATGFFSGYLPKAPGTWGSLLAVLLFVISARLLPGEGIIHLGPVSLSWWALVTGSLATAFGIWSSALLAHEWREDDPGEIVIDEFAGIFFAMALVAPDWTGALAAFIFFRLLDILKPGPIHSLQELPGGYGIVLDDVLAGIAAAPLALVAQVIVLKITGNG